MKEFKIYLAGGMNGLTYDDYTGWRYYIISLSNRSDINFFNPPRYYNFLTKNYDTEKEIMEFDLYNLRCSDLVIVNFNSPNSIGTAMELMLAKELKIPIIGINEENKQLHPWLTECVVKMFKKLEDAWMYVSNFYLN